MALNSVLLPVTPDTVFDVLLDPRTYPRWLLGADAIHDVDDDWPAPGSRFHHRVGVWPLRVSDHSSIVAVDRPHRLVLDVRATPVVRAHVSFRCLGDGDQCVLLMEEEPLSRLAGAVVRPVMDPLTHVRNHRSLRTLRAVVIERAGGSG